MEEGGREKGVGSLGHLALLLSEKLSALSPNRGLLWDV